MLLFFLLNSYALEEAYNAYEFGRFYRNMPGEFFVFEKQTCHGRKLMKECLKIFTFTNFTWTHKLKFFMIGKRRDVNVF